MTEKRTLATVPSESVTAAEMVCAVLTETVAGTVGVSGEKTGEAPELTTTVMVAEVVCEPRLSVATAVRL